MTFSQNQNKFTIILQDNWYILYIYLITSSDHGYFLVNSYNCYFISADRVRILGMGAALFHGGQGQSAEWASKRGHL